MNIGSMIVSEYDRVDTVTTEIRLHTIEDYENHTRKTVPPKTLILNIPATSNLVESTLQFFNEFAQDACKGTLATKKDLDVLLEQNGGYLRSAADNFIKQNKWIAKGKSGGSYFATWEITLKSSLPI